MHSCLKLFAAGICLIGPSACDPPELGHPSSKDAGQQSDLVKLARVALEQVQSANVPAYSAHSLIG
jgi:hypothetical protein